MAYTISRRPSFVVGGEKPPAKRAETLAEWQRRYEKSCEDPAPAATPRKRIDWGRAGRAGTYRYKDEEV